MMERNETERDTTEGTGRELPQRWGVWLAVEGDLRFLSHRDCARALERASVRARLPLKYTQGFNPHPVLALLCPRPVGVASLDDLLVVHLTEPIEADELVGRLEGQCPPGMRVLRARVLQADESPRPCSVRCACAVGADRADRLRPALRRFHRADTWPVERRRPASRRGRAGRVRRIDLKSLVDALRIEADTLRWTLVPDGDVWARGEEVLEAVGLDGRVDLASTVRTGIDYGL